MTRVKKVQVGRPALVAILLVIAALAVSPVMYILQRSHSQTMQVIGDYDRPDRIDLDVSIVKVDAAAQELVVQVTPWGRGALGDESGRFRADTTVYTNGLKSEPIQIKADDLTPVTDLQMTMSGGGGITDYPFDRYRSLLSFAASSDGKPIPVALNVYSLDAAYKVGAQPDGQPSDTAGALVTVRRSTASISFVVFVMALMLGLAWAAATAAFFLLSGKHGLIWPACTLMAAMLFAIVPLRNAVPGAPPIGSVIDFFSFFIAEAVVALALICTILVGYRHEKAKLVGKEVVHEDKTVAK